MKNLSDSKIEKSKEFKLTSIEDILKSNHPTEFDQMILNDDIDRKNSFFVRYSSKTIKRKVEKITFPLFSDISNDFKNNYCGANADIGDAKKNQSDLIKNIKKRDGVTIETYNKLNDKTLAYYEIPLEIKDGNIVVDQPLYFIPSLTKYYTCSQCNGERYITCYDEECRGRHEWTCTKCNGHGKVTCKKCNGEGETTCEKCNGNGEYRCNICKGVGSVKCPTCHGSGVEEYKNSSMDVMNNRTRRCTNCAGKGEVRCSSHAKSTSLIGKGLRMATSESCNGTGTIQCSECNTTGKITCGECDGTGEVMCNECEGNGTIVCSTCYGDSERYGKVDCPTCLTRGELGEIIIITTTIELQDTESLFQLGKAFPEANFSTNNQLELIKRYINPKYKTQETYYKIIEKAGNEISRENIDSFSKPIISNRRTTLNISIDKYPKLLEEYTYYEVVPSLSLSYKHILTNTEHKLSFIGIDAINPAIIFHSKPSEVILEKKSLKEIIVQILSKAFSTKRFRDKIDKRNAIVLLIHVAKSDQVIDHAEKLFLSKKIQDLDNFTAQEKKLLFTLMSAKELPEIKKKYVRFSSIEKEEEVKSNLVELAKLSSNIDESEQQKLVELNSLIDNSRQSKFAKFLLNFLSAWQISIPSIIFIILPLITYLLAIFIALVLSFFGPDKSEHVSQKPVISNVKEANVNIDNTDPEETKGEYLQEDLVVEDSDLDGQIKDSSNIFQQTESGLTYKFHIKGNDTATPGIGDIVSVDMIYQSVDSVIFDSKLLPDVIRIPMIESIYNGDIYEGISMMRIGDSTSFICNADSVFTKLFRMSSIPSYFDSVENIYFHIKLNDIESNEEAQSAQYDFIKPFGASYAEKTSKNVLLTLPEKYFGHWVEGLEQCEYDAGIWIEIDDVSGNIILTGLEWSGKVDTLNKVSESYYLTLSIDSEGESYMDKLTLYIDPNGTLLYNEDFNWAGANGKLIKCSVENKDNNVK